MSASDFRVVIPARYASTRLPGKPLLPIAGRPMLQHVFERAGQCGAREVVIATDDERIAGTAAGFGADVCMTAAAHGSGTERLAEVVARRGWPPDSIVVNVQGDEPLIEPQLIRQVADDLAATPEAAMATLAHPFNSSVTQRDPNVVKVVLDRAGFALYFSRAPIPYVRDAPGADGHAGLRHIGLYAYRVGFLGRYCDLEPAPCETVEKLEQLRVLWHGMKIHVSLAARMPGPGVDTEADLLLVEGLIADAG
ncbi:MAG: 3-deoxy-manno-octulosonate cytidylyltransferase [Pseudomonadota bacterium]